MSHHWIGYWEQRGYGRQAMENLVLQFRNGEIHGSGADIIGQFIFAGHTTSDGRVLINKQYIGQHCVLYDGQYDGEGAIFGQWSIGPWNSGAFMMRLSRNAEDHSNEEAIEQLEPDGLSC